MSPLKLPLKRIVAAATVSAAVLVGSTATAKTAGEACVSSGAQKTLTACPNKGPTSFNVTKHGKTPKTGFASAPVKRKLKKRDQETGARKPSEEMATAQRDTRSSRLKSRARALLVREISGMEQLFRTTPKNAPDRPQLARRLAEDYVELESAAFREKTMAEIKRDELKKKNRAEAGKQQALVVNAGKIQNVARRNAIKYYSMLRREYPNYSQLDEVLYYLAYEHEQGHDNAKARKVYLELINKRPNSKYIPNAYLAFGELFFNEAQGDPSKWELAEQAYKEVIKFPAKKSKVYGYAWYKLAYVYWNKGDYTHALNAFKKTIDYGVQYKQRPGATKLADSARRDVIPVYALKGDPSAAYNFFHTLSGDKGGSTKRTYEMMDELGLNYLDTGHYVEAITLYKDLLSRDKSGAKSCEYQAHITEATMAMKSSNKDAIRAEIDNQIKRHDEYVKGNYSGKSKLTCANKTAELVTETAMAWHLEAVGSQGQRGTGDQKTMTLAAYLYGKAADTWDAKQFSKFKFPRIIKKDWPTIYKIKYAMADLLYFQQKWAECGPAFDSVVAENPTGPDAAEAAYAAVLCYQNIYEQTHQGGADRKGRGNLPGQGKKAKKDEKADAWEELKPKDLTENQKGMINAFNRYVCYIKPGKGDRKGEEQLVEVKYARARTYFEAQHWEEAAIAFREIALEYSDKDVGIYAAQLYLESVNVLGSHAKPPRPSCFDDMASDVPKFIKLYCTGEKAKSNEEQCTILTKIECDIQRLKAQKLVELADKGGASSLQTYEQAGNTYFELWRKYGETPISQGQPAQCERLEEILYNSAKAFQAGRLIAKAIKARTTLINPKFGMDKTELARQARYEIGGNYQAIAVYDKAAEWFETYADLKPTPENADVALADAVLLRLGLGTKKDVDQAIADAKTFRSKFGSKKPAKTAAIAFAVGAHYASEEDWKDAKGALEGAMGVIKKAPVDIQAQAHATLGRSYSHLKNSDRLADKEYARVRALWTSPDAAIKAIKSSYADEDEAQIQNRVGKTLNAVGEAYFHAAEAARRSDVETIKFPAYKGPGTKDAVLKHINTKVKAWLEKKRPAIEKVEKEYKKIVDLQPEPPPRWVIAAGSRVGLMWGDFVDDFRAAPIPEAWKKDAEIRGVYYDALDQRSEPIKVQRAKPALVTCLTYSVKFQYFDEYSRRCEEWLAKNYKAEYHVVDELRGAPTRSNSALDDKQPPLLLGGELWHDRSAQEAAAKKDSAKSEGEKDSSN